MQTTNTLHFIKSIIRYYSDWAVAIQIVIPTDKCVPTPDCVTIDANNFRFGWIICDFTLQW